MNSHHIRCSQSREWFYTGTTCSYSHCGKIELQHQSNRANSMYELTSWAQYQNIVKSPWQQCLQWSVMATYYQWSGWKTTTKTHVLLWSLVCSSISCVVLHISWATCIASGSAHCVWLVSSATHCKQHESAARADRRESCDVCRHGEVLKACAVVTFRSINYKAKHCAGNCNKKNATSITNKSSSTWNS